MNGLQKYRVAWIELRDRTCQAIAVADIRVSVICYGIAVLVVILLAVLYYRTPGSQAFPLDDGYISLHSAQVLHWGKDPNFPGVPALAGVTNAPYVLLLWALLFVMPPLAALHVACWLGILCYVLGLIALSRAFQLTPAVMLAVIALGVTVGKVTYHLLNGVETGMALGLTVWMFALIKSNTAHSRRLAALLCGVIPFLRPELIALSVLVLGGIAWQGYAEHEELSRMIRQFFSLAALAAIAAAPWLIWYWTSTGTAIPQSIEAKRIFFAGGCASSMHRWSVMIHGAKAFAGVIGSFSVAALFLARNRIGKCALAFVPVFFLAYYLRLPGALFHNLGRYTYILVPIVLLGMISGLSDRSRWTRRSAYFVLALSCVQTAVGFRHHWASFTEDRGLYGGALSSVADWSTRKLPANAILLVHDAGYVSYATRFRMVDLVGLKTPSSVEFNREYIYKTCGLDRQLAVNEIAWTAKPDYLIVVDDWDRFFQISAGMSALGWHLEGVFANGPYHIYRLTPPAEDPLATLQRIAATSGDRQ